MESPPTPYSSGQSRRLQPQGLKRPPTTWPPSSYSDCTSSIYDPVLDRSPFLLLLKLNAPGSSKPSCSVFHSLILVDSHKQETTGLSSQHLPTSQLILFNRVKWIEPPALNEALSVLEATLKALDNAELGILDQFAVLKGFTLPSGL